MADPSLQNDPAFRAALLAHEQQERINTGKVAAALVVFLMPAGILLDRTSAYYDQGRLPAFLILRLACSLLAAAIWFLFTTSFGRKHYRWLGLPIAWLPAASICGMILVTDGANSPYYAGLNLILLAVSAVVHWSTRESILAVFGIVLMYGLACAGKHHTWTPANVSMFLNNVYFITVTGVIVVVGNHVFNRLRFREFTLRYELDQNRQKLEESHQKLVELDQVKSRFFANISHELRTPLTLLLAPLETLIQRFGRTVDSESRELLLTMHGNGMRLLKLINDLLDLVRLESGRMEVKKEPVEIGPFVKGLVSAARQVADDKRIQLEGSADPALETALTDRDKLEKVLLNLVFNALKFTPAGGQVTLRAEKRQDDLVLVVSDTGMGIAEKNLPFIFDRFWQADTSSKRKYQGVGIGLALVKELIELQGGKVGVESQEGRGTTFTIRLPYVPAAEVQAVPGSSEVPSLEEESGQTSSDSWLVGLYRRAELFPAVTSVQESVRPVEIWKNGQQRCILIADDEPDMLRFLKSQLTSHFRVLEAVDGQQAIDKACQFLPDIILLDMMMPEKDGLQACRELRERTPTQSIPIVMLTARADETTKLEALAAGASDFLSKPFSTTELHVRISNLVDSYEYQRKLAKQNQVLERTIEQLKDTETQLVQSEKMASLGRLSAGIIHEINNPLNFATTGLFTLRSKERFLTAEQRAEFAEVLTDVEEGVQRVRDIVSEMRGFSYADNQQFEQVNVSETLTLALRLLSHEWKDRVAIHRSIPEAQSVWANKNKLVQVLVNLLQNSLDALARKPFVEEKPTITIEGRTEGERSFLTLRDNGNGIAPAHMDKIFDPFFTTKDVGQGMGLGLSICYRIVQEHKGRIYVRSEAGKYCEFALEFPVEREPEDAAVATE
jgi:signal transduction histidine kinase